MKKRTDARRLAWIPGDVYARLLPGFTVNLLVHDVETALRFYRDVLGATVCYADPDFAAIRVANLEFMLHDDHTYDEHPWHGPLQNGDRRGLGAEPRLLGLDPDAVEDRARAAHAVVVRPATVRGHGRREVMVEDPDSYPWAVGLLAGEQTLIRGTTPERIRGRRAGQRTPARRSRPPTSADAVPRPITRRRTRGPNSPRRRGTEASADLLQRLPGGEWRERLATPVKPHIDHHVAIVKRNGVRIDNFSRAGR